MKNSIKKFLLVIYLTLTFNSMLFAVEKKSAISANINIVTNYVWRARTQSDDNKAIQGGLDWDARNGFILGIWGSSLGKNDGSEFDYYGSYSGKLNNGIGYEIGYIDYRYSKDNGSANFKESYISTSYANFGLIYYKGHNEAVNYIEGSYGTSINDIDASLTLGRYSNTIGNADGYKMYGISFGKSYDGLDYALNFTKTNENDVDVDNEENIVFSIGKSF